MNKPTSAKTAGLRAGELREITITLPIGVHDDLTAAAAVFGESREEFSRRLLLDEHADCVAGQRIGEILVTTRYYKSRAAAKSAAEKADAFDQQKNEWRFFRSTSGWFVKYAHHCEEGVPA